MSDGYNIEEISLYIQSLSDDSVTLSNDTLTEALTGIIVMMNGIALDQSDLTMIQDTLIESWGETVDDIDLTTTSMTQSEMMSFIANHILTLYSDQILDAATGDKASSISTFNDNATKVMPSITSISLTDFFSTMNSMFMFLANTSTKNLAAAEVTMINYLGVDPTPYMDEKGETLANAFVEALATYFATIFIAFVESTVFTDLSPDDIDYTNAILVAQAAIDASTSASDQATSYQTLLNSLSDLLTEYADDFSDSSVYDSTVSNVSDALTEVQNLIDSLSDVNSELNTILSTLEEGEDS